MESKDPAKKKSTTSRQWTAGKPKTELFTTGLQKTSLLIIPFTQQNLEGNSEDLL